MSNKDIGVPVAPLQDATGVLNARPQPFKGSMFLIQIETKVPKKGDVVEMFLCTRLDKHPAHVEFVGMQVDAKTLQGAPDPSLIIDKSLLTEMYVPWIRVINVRNLTYKAK